jgi:hypothetical protein
MSRESMTGAVLRERRYALEWSAEAAGSLYGESVRGKPITRKAYLKMEEGYLPADPKRRLILGAMLGLAPAVLLGEDLVQQISERFLSLSVSRKRSKPFDLAEYSKKLTVYHKQGYRGSGEQALADIISRIYTLHDSIPYASGQKEQMKRLLGSYQLMLADFYRELGYQGQALDCVNKALGLAHSEGYLDLEATMLYKRGTFYFDQWRLKEALDDLQAAQALETSSPKVRASRYPVPPQVRGCILNVRGLTQVRQAQSETQMSAALKLLDASETYVGRAEKTDIYLTRLTGEFYLRHRTKALLEAPLPRLQRPEQASKLLNEMERAVQPQEKRLHGYERLNNALIQSYIYLDQGYYPIASTLALEALSIMQQIKSQIHLPSLIRLHERLQASSYGKSLEVAEVGIGIAKAQYAHLFD